MALKKNPRADEHIVENPNLSVFAALLPVIILVGLLAFNVFVYGDDALSGSNQFILLIGAAVAAVVGVFYKVSYKQMLAEVAENVKSTTGALLILLMVGALSGTWLLSGIIPAMIYYGLEILNPTFFLVACVIICAIISVATGSSWTTAATVGIALIGIGDALGISLGMTAGAVLSGAYFGDKMSPLSDTTNLAPAMAGGELFTHIRYMTYTTVPSIVLTLVLFLILGLTLEASGAADTASLQNSISQTFSVTPWLFLVPIVVIGLIVKKAPPLLALLIGTLLGGVFALIFQPEIVTRIAGATSLNLFSAYQGVMDAMTVDISIETTNKDLNDLFSSGGMKGMLGTIWLILCAMVFGGIMDGIGALQRITKALLSLVSSDAGLIASTGASCIILNATASDQYLALVVPGKMYAQAYADRELAPENLSRTLEDTGTVTSVLIPWNTCGAYHSKVLGVAVGDYWMYAFFSLISPLTTLVFAFLKIKIKRLTSS